MKMKELNYKGMLNVEFNWNVKKYVITRGKEAPGPRRQRANITFGFVKIVTKIAREINTVFTFKIRILKYRS